MRRRDICPPGVICITPSLIILVAVILIGVSALIYVINMQRVKNVTMQIPIQPQIPIEQPIAINVERGGDDRYTRAPKPLRNWLSPVDLDGAVVGSRPVFNSGSVPVIATRGLPEAYQSMGIVTTSSGELLPLYGRRLASRSDRFNYYTRTDTNNPIPLPINHKRRDCQDDIGCEELFDGEHVEIIPTKQKGTVTIYRFNGPTYIPGMI
jgi:hypothetical protein